MVRVVVVSYASLLDRTCTIRREGAPTHEFGVRKGAALADVSTHPCRIDFGHGKERVAVSDMRALDRWATVFVAAGATDIRRGDRMVISGVADEFEVVFAQPIYGHSGVHHYEVNVERVVGS